MLGLHQSWKIDLAASNLPTMIGTPMRTFFTRLKAAAPPPPPRLPAFGPAGAQGEDNL
jgi:hypothetical protein